MRVVFFGTPDFAVPSLSALLQAGIEVAAVVTQPDRPQGRSHSRLAPPPVKRLALDAGIAVWQPEQPRGEPFYRQMQSVAADLGIVVAYGHLFTPDLLAIPRLGLVNVHASLLPRWRGAAPVQWALLSGDGQTGVAIMRIEAGLDTGPVWQSRTIAIGDTDTAGTLANQLASLGAAALLDALPRIARGESPTPQAESGVTHASKIHRDLARLRWDDTARAVSCRIRAMDPAPGAWTTIGGTAIKVFGPTVLPGALPHRAAGMIMDAAGNLVIATADAAVSITEVQPAGKRRLPAAEWLRGAHLAPEARFE